MGSVAQDQNGNIAMGYSVSSETTVFPSIRFTGRLASDTLGQMTIAEESIMQGTGSQTSRLNLWGEQSTMTIDPVDDCTFFYSNAYYEITSDSGWQTRIATFRLQDCTLSSSSSSTEEDVVVLTDVAVPIVVVAVASQQQDSFLNNDQVEDIASTDGDTIVSVSLSSSRTFIDVVVMIEMILVAISFKMAL
jgi:hypothetical protein